MYLNIGKAEFEAKCCNMFAAAQMKKAVFQLTATNKGNKTRVCS